MAASYDSNQPGYALSGPAPCKGRGEWYAPFDRFEQTLVMMRSRQFYAAVVLSGTGHNG